MTFSDRFFGRGVPRPGGPAVANPRLADPPSFHVLFPDRPDLDADALTLALRGYDKELADAAAELEAVAVPSPGGPFVMGLVGWGRHVVKLVAYNLPLPAPDVERCVRYAQYEPGAKEAACRHTAYVRLFYAGYEDDPFEQHVALAAVAGVLARFGALAVLNEPAHTSLPAVELLPHEEDGGETVAALRKFPLPILYAGFVMIEVEGEPGLWLRTHGCRAFRLPDLAFRAEDRRQGRAAFGLFSNLLAYLRESGRSLAPDDTLGLGECQFFRLRARTPDEWFLESPGELLVIEPISPEEANT